MRHISAQIETIGSARFVLLIGLAAGTIAGVPPLLLGGGAERLQLASFLVIGLAAVLWWTGALLLWWIAVRRQQSSVWALAAQVSLGLIIGDIVARALGLVRASIDTRGEFAAVAAHHLSTIVSSNLTLSLVRAPLWFVGSALAIALGRHLDPIRGAASDQIVPDHPT